MFSKLGKKTFNYMLCGDIDKWEESEFKDWPFLDLEHYVEDYLNKDIPEIFEKFKNRLTSVAINFRTFRNVSPKQVLPIDGLSITDEILISMNINFMQRCTNELMFQSRKFWCSKNTKILPQFIGFGISMTGPWQEE